MFWVIPASCFPVRNPEGDRRHTQVKMIWGRAIKELFSKVWVGFFTQRCVRRGSYEIPEGDACVEMAKWAEQWPAGSNWQEQRWEITQGAHSSLPFNFLKACPSDHTHGNQRDSWSQFLPGAEKRASREIGLKSGTGGATGRYWTHLRSPLWANDQQHEIVSLFQLSFALSWATKTEVSSSCVSLPNWFWGIPKKLNCQHLKT